MISHGRMSEAHNGLDAGSSPAGSSPLKSPSPVHDLIARNVGFSSKQRTFHKFCGPVGFVPTPEVDRVYSITKSARATMDAGITRPSAFAVLRLMARMNLSA